jgi:hypothetical protein
MTKPEISREIPEKMAIYSPNSSESICSRSGAAHLLGSMGILITTGTSQKVKEPLCFACGWGSPTIIVKMICRTIESQIRAFFLSRDKLKGNQNKTSQYAVDFDDEYLS